ALARDRAGNAERLAHPRHSTDARRERDDRIADAGQLRDAVDQLWPGEILPAEDVTLPGLPALGGEQVTRRDILDVDEVHRSVDHAGKAAAQVVADGARRGLPRLGPIYWHPQHVCGVDDDQLDLVPCGGLASSTLAGVLRVW